MTTLCPEKEAEEAVERLKRIGNAWCLQDVYLDTPAGAMDQLETDVDLVLAALSTERQAREAAEKEVEGWKETCDRQSVLMGKYAREAIEAESRLAALVEITGRITPIPEVLEVIAHLPDDTDLYLDGDQTGAGWEIGPITVGDLRALAALSALPPPVPAEEAEPVDFVDLERTLRMCEADRGHNPGMISIGVEKFRALLTRAQAPQDVAGLVEGEEDAGRELYGSGYHDGFLDGFLIGKGEDSYPDAEGEREIFMQADSENIADGWANARDHFLAALRPSPISHETKPPVEDVNANGPSVIWLQPLCMDTGGEGRLWMEDMGEECDCTPPCWPTKYVRADHLSPAAADNNHKALVEALEEIAAHPGPNADDAAHMRAEIARDALAAFKLKGAK